MTPVVIDASAGVELAADTVRGRELRTLLPLDTVPWVPEIFYVECGAVLRRWDLNGVLAPAQVATAIEDLMATQTVRMPEKPRSHVADACCRTTRAWYQTGIIGSWR